MTKKHFTLFAQRIAADLDYAARAFGGDTEKYTEAYDRAHYAANLFAGVAREFNPHFDRDRFMAACGF